MALRIPSVLITRQDARRLSMEVEALREFVIQAKVRPQGAAIPRLSPVLEAMLVENGLRIQSEADADALLKVVKNLAEAAPIMHISFAADPSAKFLQRLVTYLRAEVHPAMLLQVGLQPSIAAGCVVRTTNRYFDMSLRQSLKNNQSKLVELIRNGG